MNKWCPRFGDNINNNNNINNNTQPVYTYEEIESQVHDNWR